MATTKLQAQITDYGGRVVSIRAPDRRGNAGEVLLGFDSVNGYVSAGGAFGALLGRTANRIAGGVFVLDGVTFQLPKNDRGSTLHGGPGGFDNVYWQVAAALPGPVPTLVLAYSSPYGGQGLPLTLAVQATYRVEECWLWLTLEARTSRPTLVSLSAHPYFNLAGPDSGCVLDHVVTLPAENFLPTDARQIPTGEIRPVAETPFDFRTPTPLGVRIRQADEQLLYGKGYDHYFVLPASTVGTPRFAARAFERTNGRVLEIHTTQPGLQLYTGNQLDGSIAGRGRIYRQSAAVAFEPQGFPDAPHHAGFPASVLRPDETYRHCIGYRFGVAAEI